MRITLTIARHESDEPDLLSLDVFPDMTVDTLRSSIQAETRIEPSSQHIYLHGVLITDSTKTMEQLQISDGDMLAVHVRQFGPNSNPEPAGASSSIGQPPQSQRRQPTMAQDPEMIRLRILGDPATRAELQRTNPRMAGLLEDPERWAAMVQGERDRELQERRARQRAIQELNDDPFDVEKQAQIEEMIRQERVSENMQIAMDYNPEVFGYVHLLYIDVEVNGHKVKALVDSGAQTTVMSPRCAEACGIMRLVDKRFAGVARGVGVANIIGRVHTATIKIGPLFLACSFTVMEGKTVDLLLGLDMLKRHQACIDLAKGKLVIQGEEVEFLAEADIPKELEESVQDEPTISGPGGTTIGARSGTVSAPDPSSSQAGPSQAAAAQRTPITVPAPPPRPTFPEADIEQLITLGFSREKAIQALTTAGGNVEYAANYLFQSL